MTRFLASEFNPDGFKLEEVLLMLRRDLIARTQKIVDDPRAEARAVVDNNVRILGLLSDALHIAESSSQVLTKTFGPSQAQFGGAPRIGHL